MACLTGVVAGCTKSEGRLAEEALQRGLEAQNAGSYDEATSDYLMALQHDPSNVFAYYDLGLIKQLSSKPVDAENYYRLALSHDPDYAPALFNLALLRANAGSYAEVVDLLNHYLSERPDDATGHLHLADALTQLGRAAEARTELDKAVALDPALLSPAPSGDVSPPAGSPSP